MKTIFIEERSFIYTLINCTLLGGTDPLLGIMAMGLSPEYFSLNSPDLEPWLKRDISFDMVLLLATKFPKYISSSISNTGWHG